MLLNLFKMPNGLAQQIIIIERGKTDCFLESLKKNNFPKKDDDPVIKETKNRIEQLAILSFELGLKYGTRLLKNKR